MPGYFRPEGVPSDGTADSYAILFERCGFEHCDDGSLEPDMEKIAIYAVGYFFRHVARQLLDGKWTSKLGRLEDIEHESLDALCGEEYGKVVIFMKRRRGGAMIGAHP